MTWLVMQRSAWNDIESRQTRRLNNSTKYLLHASMTTNFKEEEIKSVGELSKVSSHIVPKCLYLARVGRPDILWSVNKLARSITKWTKECEKRLNRLISYIHHTSENKQCCHVRGSCKEMCGAMENTKKGYIADLAALPRDSGDVKALAFDWITAGSQPGHVQFQKFFRQAHETNGPTAKRLSSSPPSIALARMLDVSFELPYMGPSDGKVLQQRGTTPSSPRILLVTQKSWPSRGVLTHCFKNLFPKRNCCDGPARHASGRKCTDHSRQNDYRNAWCRFNCFSN